MPLILRLSIRQSTLLINRQTYRTTTKQTRSYSLTALSRSGSWCAFSYSMCNTRLHLSTTHVPDTSLVKKKNDYAYCLHCSLCAGLLHGSMSSMALYQSVYSFPCCVCVVRLLNAWLNIPQGCAPITFSHCSACTTHMLTAWRRYLAWLCTSQLALSLVLHALCACLMHG